MENAEIPNSPPSSFRSNSRVLFLLLSPLPSPGAAWSRIGFFAGYLKGLGINVSVAGAFSAKTREKAGSTGWNGIRIHNLIPVIMLTNTFIQILNIILASIVGLFLFLIIRPRIVVISVPSSGNPLGCYFIARLFKCKVITDYRDQWEEYNYALLRSKASRIFYRMIKNTMTKCYRHSDTVITPTEPFATSLRRRGVENVKLIRNGADTTVFRPKDKALSRRNMGLSDDDFVIIYSGHIGAYYRVDLIIHAIKLAIDKHKNNLKLIMAGHGSALPGVLKLAREIGLQDNVLYIGKIMDKEKLSEAICAADVGIIPYDSNILWKNSIPVKSLEYLACGLPVIATADTESLLGKLIVDNRLGSVARPENVESLAEAINKLEADSDLRRNVGIRAISLIRRDYDRHILAAQFYSQLVGYLNQGQ